MNGALDRTADLLNEVFAPDTPITAADLAWYYDQNPRGSASVGRIERDGRRLGNYALIPQVFRSANGTVTLGLGVDLAVSPAARGTGAFRATVEDAYRRGTAAGIDGILGVANANSAPRMADTLGWRRLPAFPVRMCTLSLRVPTVAHHPVDEEFLASDLLDDLAGRVPPVGYGPQWDPEYTRWRLARPGRHYTVHRFDDVLAVSTSTPLGPARAAVVLKVLPRRGWLAPVAGSSVARAIAHHHRTPFVVHWGHTSSVRWSGLPLPRRFMPSPLELVLHQLRDGWARDHLQLADFEFLDFDAF